jgi:hypothetical protein
MVANGSCSESMSGNAAANGVFSGVNNLLGHQLVS